MSVYQDCRMYEAKFPEVDDVVMVQVRCQEARGDRGHGVVAFTCGRIRRSKK